MLLSKEILLIPNTTSQNPKFSEGQGGAKFSEEARFSRATIFFCKHVISVARLVLTFLTAIWLPHNQLWTILKGTASLIQC